MNLSKFAKILPKWRNFAKSGHTVRVVVRFFSSTKRIPIANNFFMQQAEAAVRKSGNADSRN